MLLAGLNTEQIEQLTKEIKISQITSFAGPNL